MNSIGTSGAITDRPHAGSCGLQALVDLHVATVSDFDPGQFQADVTGVWIATAGDQEVRASSIFGFSLLTVVFDDKIDNYFARTRVLERLSFLQTLLPEGVTPQLGPDATGLGSILFT